MNRTDITYAEASQKFTNQKFTFARTGRRARNFIASVKQVIHVEIEVGDEWELVKMNLRQFLNDKPELIEA